MRAPFFYNKMAVAIAFGVIVLSTATLTVLSYYYTVGQANLVEGTLVQNSFQLVEQTVDRIEQKIVENDRTLALLVNVDDDATWRQTEETIQGMDLWIDSVWFLKPNGDIVYPKYRPEIKNPYGAVKKHFSDRSMNLDKLPLNQIYHLHKERIDNYFFASYVMKQTQKEEKILICFLMSLPKSKDFISRYLEDLGKNQYARVMDFENNTIPGLGDSPISGRYIVQLQFPKTFYKWILQIAPRSSAEMENTAKKLTRTVFFLINLSIILIFLSLAIIYSAGRRARQLVQLKEDFIGNVSHELKTPLSLIRMFSEILVLGKVKNDEAKSEYYRIIHRESERMSRLIANLLDFAALERELSPRNLETVRIGDLVTQALDGYRHQIQNEGFKLVSEIEENIPEVSADPNALTMAFFNLLDNSVKYSKDQKEITVSVRRTNGFIDLSVSDLGLGIPEVEHKRIFEKFYRGNNAAVQKIRGSGIGLSITKRVAEMHGGEVLVKSEPGRGSVFTLRIPISSAF